MVKSDSNFPGPSTVIIAALCLLASTESAAYHDDISARVASHSQKTHYVLLGANEHFVTVIGDGSTDLDCWIYDQRSRLIDSDTDSTDYCVLSTRGAARHRLVIRNLGSVHNDYVVSRRLSAEKSQQWRL